MQARSVSTLPVFAVTLMGAVGFAQTSASPKNGAWVADAAVGTYEAASHSPWTAAPLATMEPEPARSSRATVSIQELTHAVPGKATRELERAEKARMKRQFDVSIEHLKRAVQIDPEFVAARNNLAAVYLLIGNAAPAVEQLEQAVKLDPHSPMPFSNLALGYMLLHRPADAERAARQTIELDRVNLRPRMILGLAMVMQQKLNEEALSALERAEPQFPQAHLLAARILAARGDSDKAKIEIDTYLSTGDQSGVDLAHEWLATIHEAEQKTTAAALR